jgi:uncharacterized membrane protein/thiol-disulfide isomerase/thioredoxin
MGDRVNLQRRSKSLQLAILFILLGIGWLQVHAVEAETAVVRAVLFYSPSCPHCHQVITVDLPPLFEKYGEQLEMVGVDTSTAGGAALFAAAIQRFDIPPERQAVPMLIVDNVILLGSLDIPEQFPILIEHYLAIGGVDWPDIPGLREALASSEPEQTPTAAQQPAMPTVTPTVQSESLPALSASTQTPTPSSPTSSTVSNLSQGDPLAANLKARLLRDPVGNSLSILVMAGMIVSVGGVASVLLSPATKANSNSLSWAIPCLCVAGLGVAGYLAYVEISQVEAVCGPVGDCNTVQQSEYAHLFGLIPVGVVGLLGYSWIGVLWLIGRFGRGQMASLAWSVLLASSFIGALFSIYLTFLEPFVIGATCAWCLSAAVIMTLLLWLAAIPGKSAIKNFFDG